MVPKRSKWNEQDIAHSEQAVGYQLGKATR